MRTKISALLELQAIESQLAHVKRRRRIREHAVEAQEQRIEQLQADYDATHERAMNRRKDADRLELDLRQREERVSRQRTALNAAKTNKEYAAILTQINTLRADNSRLEEQTLSIMQDVDSVNAEAEKLLEQVQEEQACLVGLRKVSTEEVEKLDAMLEDLSAKRARATGNVGPEGLAVFNRLAESYDGEAMAVIDVHGKKPPHEYVCGGCFMSLTPEHANSLRTRDEIRRCGNCGRILYLKAQSEALHTS